MGYLNIIGKKPGKQDVQPKFSYSTTFKAWDWVIITGAYVDDIEDKITLMEENAEEKITEVISTIVLISSIIVIIIAIIIILILNKLIIKPINVLNNGIQSLIKDTTNTNMTIKKQSNDELGDIVDSFNAYLGKIDEGMKEDQILIEDAKTSNWKSKTWLFRRSHR